MKKFIALMLALCMMAVLFTGCGGEGNSSTSSKESSQESSAGADGSGVEEGDTPETRDVGGLQLPLCEEKQELSMWTVYGNNTYADPNDLPGVQELERRTNVHVNWIPVALSELSEKQAVLFSSGNYPDIIYAASYSYPGGIAKGVQDGVIIDMDPIIRENMPNYMAILESNEQARREATSDEGKLDSVRIIVSTDTTVQSEGTYYGLVYRKDIFDKMNMELPETISQWHDVFLAAKESGMNSAFVPNPNGGSNLSLAYGVTTASMDNYLQLDGDKVICSATQDGFGQYLDEMRKWYSEGIINPNFTSGGPMATQDFSSLENNDSMMYNDWVTAICANVTVRDKMVTNQDVYLQPITKPVLNVGDEPIQCFRRVIAKDPIYITSSCKDPVLAAKWLDYWWSTEGAYLSWYGIEGTTYEIGEDGTPQYTDLIFDNPDDLTPSNALQNYAFNPGGSWLGRHIITAAQKLNASNDGGNVQTESEAIFSAPKKNIKLSESISFTDAEGVEISSLQTAANTLIEEYMVNYINGTDNTSFEDFRNKLNQYGAERICEIYQAAYDRYLER